MKKFYAVIYNNDYSLNNYSNEALREWKLATVVYFNSKYDRDEWCAEEPLRRPCTARFAKYMAYGRIKNIEAASNLKKEVRP